MRTETNRQYAYFALYGDFDPDTITAQLGINPSESWRKGDLHPRRQYERKQSHWSLYSRLDESAALEEHIIDVLEQLDAKPDIVQELCTLYQGCMQLVGFFHDNYPGLRLEQEHIKRIAESGLMIDVDFYALWSDARDAT